MRLPEVDPIQQPSQLLLRYLRRLAAFTRPRKSMFLQFLAQKPKTGLLPVQPFEYRAPLVTEHVYAPRKRILPKLLCHYQRQPEGLLSHVRGLRPHKHLHARPIDEHPFSLVPARLRAHPHTSHRSLEPDRVLSRFEAVDRSFHHRDAGQA